MKIVPSPPLVCQGIGVSEKNVLRRLCVSGHTGPRLALAKICLVLWDGQDGKGLVGERSYRIVHEEAPCILTQKGPLLLGQPLAAMGIDTIDFVYYYASRDGKRLRSSKSAPKGGGF